MSHSNLVKLVLLAFKAKDCFSTVRLNKALYYFDSFWYAAKGETFTGSDYDAKQMGPMCAQLDGTLSDLVNENLLSVSSLDNYDGNPYSVYTLTSEGKKFVESVLKNGFEEDDGGVGFFLDVVQRCACMKQKTLVEMSHNRAWKVARTSKEKLDFDDNDWLL